MKEKIATRKKKDLQNDEISHCPHGFSSTIFR
jgi:hypothetical protein